MGFDRFRTGESVVHMVGKKVWGSSYSINTRQNINRQLMDIIGSKCILISLQGKNPLADIFEESQRKIPHTSVSSGGY